MPNSNLQAEWKTAKKEFEKVTGEKRPKESFLKVFTKGSGIEPALKKCDELANAPSKKGSADKLKEAVKDLMKKTNDYLVLLDKEIVAEGKTNPGIKTDLLKALKALKAKTTKFESHYAVSILEHEKSPMELMTALGDPLLKKTVDSALADVKRVLAKPDWQTYEAVMSGGNGAGRRLSTSLQALTNTTIDTAAFKQRFYEYATGSKMTMPATSSKQDVIDEIKAFERIVKDLKAEMP